MFERARALMELIGKYRDCASKSYREEVPLVTGNIDVGVYGSFTARGAWL